MALLARSAPRTAGAKRFYAQAAAQALKGEWSGASSIKARAATETSVSKTVLPNGLVVFSSDDQGAVSSVTAFVRAGTRNETAASSGCTQFATALAYHDTANRTGLWIKRETESLGIKTSSKYDREFVVYNTTALRKDMPRACDNLADAVSCSLYNDWDVKDARKRVALQNDSACEFSRLSDLLHRTAYRTALGNPLLTASHQVSKVTGEALRAYSKALFTADRTVIVASGVNHEDLLHMLRKDMGSLGASSSGAASTNKYFGGESYHEGSGNTTVLIAHSAFGRADSNAAAASVLRALLGSSCSAVQYGNSTSPLAASVSPVASASVKCYNHQYADAGLFGIVVSAPGAQIAEAAKRASDAMRSMLGGNFTSDDVKRAKAQAKNQLLDSTRCERNRLVATTGHTAEELAAAVDQVTEASLKQAAKTIGQSKRTFVAKGSSFTMPYAEQI